MEKVSFLTGFPGFGIDFTVYYKRKILLLFLKGSWYNNRTDNSIPGGGGFGADMQGPYQYNKNGFHFKSHI